MAIPTFVAAGAMAADSVAITPALPTGIQTDDILLLFIETGEQVITIANANGGTWTEVADSPQGTNGGATATRLTVFWSRYNGTQGAPTTSDSGNHQIGVILAFRGCITTGDPWDVTSGGVDTTSDNSLSATGDTTTVADCLVVVGCSRGNDLGGAAFSLFANADLANVTEVFDNGDPIANGGGIGIATGEKAAAGSFGATTATLANNSLKGFISIALKPPAAGGGGATHPGWYTSRGGWF